MRRCALAVACGCGIEPNPAFDLDSSSSPASDTEASTASSSSPTTTASDSGETTVATDTGSDDGTTGPIPAGCGDGSNTGELCLFPIQVLDFASFGTGTVAVADINADGLPELITGLADGSLLVFIGTGSQYMQTVTGLHAGVFASVAGIVPADLDSDGRPDLVISFVELATVCVFRSTWSYTAPLCTDLVEPPRGLGTATFDDGLVDVIALGAGADIAIYPGDGAGGLGAAAMIATPLPPLALTVGDLDLDGQPDLVVTRLEVDMRTQYGYVSVLSHQSAFAEVGLAYVGWQPGPMVLDDFNGDGVPDIAVAEVSSKRVRIFHGDGSGGLVDGPTIHHGRSSYAIASGDFNGDGLREPIVAHGDDEYATVLLNSGPRLGFDDHPQDLEGIYPLALAVVDLNFDGIDDVPIGTSSGLGLLFSYP